METQQPLSAHRRPYGDTLFVLSNSTNLVRKLRLLFLSFTNAHFIDVAHKYRLMADSILPVNKRDPENTNKLAELLIGTLIDNGFISNDWFINEFEKYLLSTDPRELNTHGSFSNSYDSKRPFNVVFLDSELAMKTHWVNIIGPKIVVNEELMPHGDVDPEKVAKSDQEPAVTLHLHNSSVHDMISPTRQLLKQLGFDVV